MPSRKGTAATATGTGGRIRKATGVAKNGKHSVNDKAYEIENVLPAPKVESRIGYLRAGDIRSDPNYQRPLEQSAVQRIVDNFDADAFGLPFVLEDENRVPWAIDGQTRTAAVVQLWGPDTLIECEIVSGITIARAAQLFRQRNDSRQVLPVDKFLAGVTAGDPECVAINEVVNSVGLVVERSGGNGKGVVRGVSTLQRIYRGLKKGKSAPRPELLRQTLAVLGEAWGPDNNAFSASGMLGLAMVLDRYGKELNVRDLIDKLKSYPGGSLRMVAAGKALRDSLGGSTAQGVAMSIVHRYNYKKTVGRLPDWREAAMLGSSDDGDE